MRSRLTGLLAACAAALIALALATLVRDVSLARHDAPAAGDWRDGRFAAGSGGRWRDACFGAAWTVTESKRKGPKGTRNSGSGGMLAQNFCAFRRELRRPRFG